ncbi:hypothetical protein QM012_004644 [Aureobasidium pullulans]|uniref:Uncharacterized protein n=1 Tax=Aureobasidium pullulans TaxID=5580 RepID=A0ABR0TTQ5_AURPU
MCLIKKEKTTRADGRLDTKKILYPCNNSVNGRACDNTVTTTEHMPGDFSQLSLRPSSSRRDQVVLHQDPPRHRPEPREERRYATKIGVRIRNWFPEFSIHRLDDGGYRSRRRRGNGESRGTPVEIMPEAPMPPQPVFLHQSSRRSPPPSALPILVPPSNGPTPQGPGAAAAFTTRDTVPSSSGTPSRTSSTRSREVHRAVQGLSLLTVPASGSSVTSSRNPRPTPGLSRRCVNPRPEFRDSTYGGSSNISPVDAPKIDILSETRSNTTSEHSASEKYNYNNAVAVIKREDYGMDEEDEKSSSSEGRKRYHARRHEDCGGIPEPDK